ncbi:hypothetical protein SAMN04487895_101755 [Paenibacillus sophorae]|uniref:Uncharacterized protein n=1 Tax=Paenibacillus sophorae TaxID=1333845 RepID=A0A1H8H484_9BACL|nr:hypothetical protein [Paenibacillus sophorae]QWU14443.1 hypothetical protein KP014_21280 [Paenibacillus sophorae]SEN51201.1 hypothetical protein SAMN04487895_101755 [Paenibacillus sophorae]
MPQFNNLSELEKYLNTGKGQQTVFGQRDVRKALNEAAKLLEKIMHEELEAYYASYTPVDGGYERTYGLLNSLRISPITQVGNELHINVYFDRESATHPSIFGGEDGYVAKLINDGWSWSNTSVNIYHLSHYEGFHFVEKALQRFSSENKWGFRISKNNVAK